MRESHPYGWVQWYCDYYSGKRSADDAGIKDGNNWLTKW